MFEIHVLYVYIQDAPCMEYLPTVHLPQIGCPVIGGIKHNGDGDIFVYVNMMGCTWRHVNTIKEQIFIEG